jgi:threonine synthase
MTDIFNKEKSENPEIVIVKELPFPENFNPDIVEKWAQGIPLFSENDPENPEWQPTPTQTIEYQGRKILIKDESANPTGTMKDRPAWEMACLYRDLARMCLLKGLTEREIRELTIPSLSILSSGNAGLALADLFKKFDLPPPRILVGNNTHEAIINELEKLYANIYLIDLNKPLSANDILEATNNTNGKDITSDQTIEPQVVFYDWLVHEVFNEIDHNPDKSNHIYMPYGSGRLFESFLYWQVQSIKRYIQNIPPDPRLKINPLKLLQTSLHGAEPSGQNSSADKLTANYKPFLLFQREEAERCIPFQQTGKQTSVEDFDECRIKKANELMKKYNIKSEDSGSAGLALAIEHIEEEKISDNDQIIIINTGSGLIKT